ncbi:MAG: response regulator [bacterium]|nr:response regulator [bacterium]
MPETNAPRVLVIDDDRAFLEIAKFHLEQVGVDVEVAFEPEVGFNRAIDTDFHLILLDLNMPGMHGEEVLRLMKPLGRGQRILVISGESRDRYQARARDLGAVGYLQKPVDAKILCGTVLELVGEPRGDEREDAEPPVSLPGITHLTAWIFGEARVTFSQQIAAVGVLAGFLGVLIWLFWGNPL